MKILVLNPYSSIITRITHELSSHNHNVVMITSLYRKKGTILDLVSRFIPSVNELSKKRLIKDMDTNNIIVKAEFFRIFNQIIYKFPKLRFVHKINEKIINNVIVHETLKFIKSNDVDILIVYDPSSIISKLTKQNISIKKVLIMTGASPKFVLDILKKEEQKFPNYKLYREFDFNYNYIEEYNKSIIKFDLIIAPSLFALNSLPQNPKLGKVLSFGYENSSSLKKIMRYDEELRVVFIGRTTLLKGFHYLVELAKSLLEYNVKFYFLGDSAKNLKFKINIPNNIIMLGRRKNDEVLDTLSNSDVLFHPTLSEGQSIAIMEALFIGIPIITTKASGYSNIISNQTGFIVDEINIEEIKQIIISILKDKRILTDRSLKSNDLINELTWENYGKALFDLLSEMMKSKV